MKVVFLDIDGVLNSEDYVRSFRYKKRNRIGFPDSDLDPVAIQMINVLCKETGAKLVISSTWRELDDCIPALERNGLKAEIIGKTPNLDKQLDSGVWTSKTRGDEIQAWLNENNYEQYLIIDDDSDMLESQKDRFVQTDAKHGFTNELLEKAIQMLSTNESS